LLRQRSTRVSSLSPMIMLPVSTQHTLSVLWLTSATTTDDKPAAESLVWTQELADRLAAFIEHQNSTSQTHEEELTAVQTRVAALEIAKAPSDSDSEIKTSMPMTTAK